MAVEKGGGNVTITGKSNSSKLTFSWVGTSDVTLPSKYEAAGEQTSNGSAIAGDPGATAEYEYNVTLNGRVLRKLMPAYECRNKDELYSKIGAGIISLDNLDKLLKENSSRKILKFWKLLIPGSEGETEGDDVDDLELDDELSTLDDTVQEEGRSDAPEFVMAECCEPIPGDNVVGYRNPKSGVIEVHKSTCDKLIRLAAQSGENIVKEEIKWSQHKAVSYLASVEISGVDRPGVLLDLSRVITADFSINMRAINIHSHDGIFEGTISLYVLDLVSLNALLDNIRQIKGVDRVKRLLNT
jgi:GTP pyrophosphokinase